MPGTQAIDDTVRVLEARAHAEGVVQRPSLRVADVGGKTYLDLVTPNWDAVEIDRDGWSLVPRALAAFVRTGQMRPLPMPEGGSDIRELRRFVNVDRDEDFVLLVAWIIAALRATGPYPVLVLCGEQGTGKSTVSRLVRSMIDPNAALWRSIFGLRPHMAPAVRLAAVEVVSRTVMTAEARCDARIEGGRSDHRFLSRAQLRIQSPYHLPTNRSFAVAVLVANW